MAPSGFKRRQQLQVLLSAVMRTDDPTLLERAVFALSALLTEYPDYDD